MNRRSSIAVLAALAGAALLPVASHAQAPAKAKLPRVAILMFGSRANFQTRSDAFVRGMSDLGYEDKRNVRYEWHSANGQDDLLRTNAQAIARDSADVIVSASTVTTRALRTATKTHPIVMGAAEDPVGEGFVQSLARPGTNVTGVSASVLEQVPHQLEILLDLAPRITRVTALLNPDSAAYRAYRTRLDAAIKPGMRLTIVDAKSREEIDRALSGTETDGTTGLLVMNDSMLYNERRNIAEIAMKLRLPSVYPLRGFVEAGGLVSYGPNPEANFVRAASYVDKILKGAKPGDLAVDPPARFELAVNRETAQHLGLTLKPAFLKQATVVG